MAKIIVLNGPAGCGKDTIGKMLAEHHAVRGVYMGFKDPMFDIAHAMLGERKFELFMLAYNNREEKEKPQAILSGMTCREFMIWLSESVVKPRFGDGYFGYRFAERALESKAPVICTDCGFNEEIAALVGWHEVKLCRLHRRGYDFTGDSRSYIERPSLIGFNGYEEEDFYLVDNEPEVTIGEILYEFF